MAVVHSLIENHGGKILVESEEGVGSNFIIALPVSGKSESEMFSGESEQVEKVLAACC